MTQLIDCIFHKRYRIQSLLGRQTGRRTCLATDLQTGASVVVKLLLFGPDFTWSDLKLFEREAAVLKSLDHPAIPKYLDSFEVETEIGKGFVLVQSYIKAKSLQQWMQSGRTFSESELRGNRDFPAKNSGLFASASPCCRASRCETQQHFDERSLFVAP